MRSPCLLLGLLMMALAGCSPATSGATPEPARTAAPTPTLLPDSAYRITGATVIDVARGVTLPGRTVIVDGSQIQLVLSPDDAVPTAGGREIDGRGLYLMPGLFDAHVHFYDAPVFGRLLLANGVLFVRDMGMPNEYILPLRDQLNHGEIPGPEMVATGWILDGYPALIPSISLGLHSVEEAQAAVRSQAAAGVDLIKVYSLLPRDLLLAILDEARAAEIKVVGHVPNSVDLEDAAVAGLSSSEHLFGFDKAIGQFLGEPLRLQQHGMGADAGYLTRLGEVDPQSLSAFYGRIRESGLTVCPTVVVFKAGTRTRQYQAGQFDGREYVSARVLEVWNTLWGGQVNLPDSLWRSWAEVVRGLNQAGVPLMVGTDLSVPGILPGFSVHEEMLIWQEAGIPPADVLRGATLTPAQFLGLDSRLGSITEGKDATMVLLRANPLEDVRHAAEIEGVFQRGQYHDRADLDRLLEEARELVRNPSP